MASVKQSIINSLQGRKITSQEDVKNSQAFCMKPWLHLFVSHYGTVAPCCLTPWDEEGALGNINQQSVQEIWDGKLMHDFRKKMLRDERDSRCSQCYESEKMGLRSSRHMTNYLYADKINWALDTDWNGQSKD
ncbi:MAG: SPASM domain-containing protein, partial [Bacteroidetes bacterium]|nr:SPASM domain-containing protein [Bacteroidota bacterium]